MYCERGRSCATPLPLTRLHCARAGGGLAHLKAYKARSRNAPLRIASARGGAHLVVETRLLPFVPTHLTRDRTRSEPCFATQQTATSNRRRRSGPAPTRCWLRSRTKTAFTSGEQQRAMEQRRCRAVSGACPRQRNTSARRATRPSWRSWSHPCVWLQRGPLRNDYRLAPPQVRYSTRRRPACPSSACASTRTSPRRAQSA